jgi:hypothetical protein
VKCPSCHKAVKDGAAICPHCEAILDESILGAIPDDNDDAPENTPPASNPYRGKYSEHWTEEEARPSSRRPSVPAPADDSGEDPFEQLKALWASFRALHFEDKLTVSSAAAHVVMCLMPWRSVGDEDEIGLLSWGFLTALLAVVALVAVWARKHGRLGFVPSRILPFVSAGAGGLSMAIIFLYIVGSFEKTVEYGRTVWASWPAFGSILALLSTAGVLLGSILTSRRK